MKIIVCEKCFSIPKITIINSLEVDLECQSCKSNKIYFINLIISKDL